MTIQFSHNFGHGKTSSQLAEITQRAENQGFYALYTADHIGMGSPFIPLSFMAAHSTAIKLGTLVLNAAFYNVSLLYRELDTLSALLADRLIIGIGAGHMKAEFTEIGMKFPSYLERIAHLRKVSAYVKEQFPTTTLLLAGGSASTLDLANEYAHTIGISGLIHKKGSKPGSFRLLSAERTHSILKECLDSRTQSNTERETYKKLQVLIQCVIITHDIDSTEKELSAKFDLSPTELRKSPYLLYGYKTAIVEKIHYLHTEYGFQEFTTHFPFSSNLAEIIPYFS